VSEDAFLEGAETAEELFEDAPCGYLATTPDGRIVRANRTFERLTGLTREDLVARRFADLLTGGGRIYHETHYAPLLRMQGWVREIALDIRRADGSLLPALVNSVLAEDIEGRPALVRTAVFDATDRRRYEQELLRARERERDIAVRLARSLLVGDLPRHEALDVDVVYQPADDLEAGGDWYDAFWLTEGASVALVVGDVVGRGLGAAASMGQLRSAVRALAGTGLSPGALLEAMDRYCARHGLGEMTTMACAALDLRDGALTLACAGHPPPIVIEPTAPARLVWEGRSPPLAARVHGRPRDETTLRLEPGASILLFTDGLFERADRPLLEGLDEVVRSADAARDEPVTALTRSIVDALVPGTGRRDDVCLLAARLG
jgi:PAS domain S-box-containing protein